MFRLTRQGRCRVYDGCVGAVGEQGGVLQSVDVEASLSPDARWQASRFLELEQYMLRFLTGVRSSGRDVSCVPGMVAVDGTRAALARRRPPQSGVFPGSEQDFPL